MAAFNSEHPVKKSIAVNFHLCNPALQQKYSFYLVLWDRFIKFIRVFSGNWQYNVEIRKLKFL